MPTKLMVRLFPIVLICACAPMYVSAQAAPDSVKRRNDCRLAAQVLASGHPAPREEWALAAIWSCPDAGPALATALKAARTSTDSAYLNALTAPLSRLHDGAVFTAAMEVAGDNAASVPARLASFRALITSVHPGAYVDLATLARDDPRMCFSSRGVHTVVVAGTPVPADVRQQVRSLARRIFADISAPRAVHQAAECTIVAVERQ